jgi:hypothetical protein
MNIADLERANRNARRLAERRAEHQRGLALGWLGNVAGAERHDLTDQEIAVLVIASQPDYPAGHTEHRVLVTFGWSMTTYAQHLNKLIADERALAFNPVLVNRCRRQRAARLAKKGL